jgi:hypothetical protein
MLRGTVVGIVVGVGQLTLGPALAVGAPARLPSTQPADTEVLAAADIFPEIRGIRGGSRN